MLKHYEIRVNGIVQGVGFRPFIHNLAHRLELTGQVVNTSTGVVINVEGGQEKLIDFVRLVRSGAPPLADIQKVTVLELPLANYDGFAIKHSVEDEEKKTLISPDVSICPDCLRELFDAADRRFLYPFINCTNCGPRFTIIEDVPYDRPLTSMKVFPMCAQCQQEYDAPENRRFHAQPNACAECGPQVWLLNREGQRVEVPEPIRQTSQLLKEGKIVAIKGVGGYHLACDAGNPEAVAALRSRKYREDKPFAVMFPSIAEVEKLCQLSNEEKSLLQSIKRPIVLLRKIKEKYRLAEQVAPNNDFLGVMLPYTPLHYILFHYYSGALVMTSANVSDEPIAYKDADALERLGGIADYFLTNDREICHRCDDSVTRVFDDGEYLLRRSRGYAPAPLGLDLDLKQILACGGEQKNTYCLTKENNAFLSHHIGDLENIETLGSYTEGIDLYKKLFDIEPRVIAYDLHPEYLSTKYALQLEGTIKVPVQHHHAHVVSCMAEHGLKDEVIGVAFDGTGFGTDGRIWGGEFLVCTLGDFRRAAHLKYVAMPGGSKAVKEPWRMAASQLLQVFGDDDWLPVAAELLKDIKEPQLSLIAEMVRKNINSPLTSSMGRLFDAVGALVGLRNMVNYEGQGAVELEQTANLCYNKKDVASYCFEMELRENVWEINSGPLITELIGDVKAGIAIADIAYRFHFTVSEMIIKVSGLIRRDTGINKACLSGGVFQNLLLLELAVQGLRREGFEVFIHRRVPANDGGISLGQAVIANERS